MPAPAGLVWEYIVWIGFLLCWVGCNLKLTGVSNSFKFRPPNHPVSESFHPIEIDHRTGAGVAGPVLRFFDQRLNFVQDHHHGTVA
jgi:hypothetical protein